MRIRMPPKDSVAEGVGSIKGKSAMAVARQVGGRQRQVNGEAFWVRGDAVSTVGFEADQSRRYIRDPQPLDEQGQDEDGDFKRPICSTVSEGPCNRKHRHRLLA